eukprot:2432097-Heterocapsa_arctica.AAC.1
MVVGQLLAVAAEGDRKRLELRELVEGRDRPGAVEDVAAHRELRVDLPVRAVVGLREVLEEDGLAPQ